MSKYPGKQELFCKMRLETEGLNAYFILVIDIS
jgi:hypothetical protein